jgi:putative membrane protein
MTVTDIGTQLAFERTQAAYERTMMAWVRTSTSLITFGFAVYKFFEFEAKSTKAIRLLAGPKEFALLMVAAGFVALVLAGWDYQRRVRSLRKQCAGLEPSRAMIVVAAIAVIAVFAFVAVLVG